MQGGHRGGAASLGASGSFPAAARRRPPAPRHQRYDKQKFLQANFRFLVASESCRAVATFTTWIA